MSLQTEFPFTLPHGYLDAQGELHREGVMRLATAYDEIAPMKDPRVQANPGYLVVILLPLERFWRSPINNITAVIAPGSSMTWSIVRL